MINNIIDGKKLAEKLKESYSNKLKCLNADCCLVVIQVGNNSASSTYVRNKERACEQVGIKSIIHKLDEYTTTEELCELITRLNVDSTVDGILVQLPLPKHINERRVIDTIAIEKDVDGFKAENLGKVMLNDPEYIPCTPQAIMKLLHDNDISVSGKHCVIVGRSNIVGKPLSMLLLNEDATVTICHSKTANLKQYTQQADILIVAVGKEKLIDADMVKPGVVVIDVGINRTSEGKLCGDVDFESVAPLASYITPVPGGVGPMTVTMLIRNTLQAAVDKYF